MTIELARSLMASGAVAAGDVEAALLDAVSRGVAFAQALVDRDASLLHKLDDELGRHPGPSIQTVRVVPQLVAALPPRLCDRLLAVPVSSDPITGIVDVAVVDPFDTHIAEEFSFHLRSAVRVVRAPYLELISALEGLRTGGAFSLGASRVLDDAALRTPAFGTPVKRPSQAAVAGAADASLGTTRIAGARVTLEQSRAQMQADASEPPIPLVKKSSDSQAWRSTTRPGVGQGGSSVRELGEDEQGEPVIGLYRAKAPPGAVAGTAADFEPAAQPSSQAGLEEVILALERAEQPDEIAGLAVHGVQTVAELAIVFAVRSDCYQARAVSFGAGVDLRSLRVPMAQPSVLQTALRAGFYLGPLAATPAHRELRQALGSGADSDVYAVSVQVLQRPVLVLLASGIDATTLASQRIDEVARAAGEALERILRRRKGAVGGPPSV